LPRIGFNKFKNRLNLFRIGFGAFREMMPQFGKSAANELALCFQPGFALFEMKRTDTVLGR